MPLRHPSTKRRNGPDRLQARGPLPHAQVLLRTPLFPQRNSRRMLRDGLRKWKSASTRLNPLDVGTYPPAHDYARQETGVETWPRPIQS